MKRLFILLASVACVSALGAIVVRAQTAKPSPADAAIVGVWKLDADLSDKPPSPDDGAGRSGRGRGGRGGFGGGHGRSQSPENGSRDDDGLRRRFEAIRDLMNPPDRLMITTSDTMVILTGGDGRTTRLLADGTKVKDESTRSERRTKWLDASLVSEISGLGPATITQTFTPDVAQNRLSIVLKMEARSGGRDGQESAGTSGQNGGKAVRTITRVYERDTESVDGGR